MNKHAVIMILLLLFVLTARLAACDAGAPTPPDSNRIQADINEYADFLPDGASVRSVTVYESRLDQRAGIYEIEVEIRTGGDAIQRLQARMIYTLNDNEQWMLSEIKQLRPANLPSAPTSGVMAGDIPGVLQGYQIDVEGEQWIVDYQSTESIAVSGRDTQLDNNKETLLITLRLRDEVLIASGQMQLDYIYDDDEWVMVDCQVAAPFTTSSREGTEHELVDEDVFEEIQTMSFLYGDGDVQQSVSIASGEASDFAAEKILLKNKGLTREYSYSFVLDKGLAAFNITAVIEYQYNRANGWERKAFTIVPAVFSVSLEGTVWSGEHVFHRTRTGLVEDPKAMVLEITYEDAGGTVYAAISFGVDDVTIAHRFSGTFDWDTLILDLQFDRWASEFYSGDGYFTDYQKPFTGYIILDDLTLKSIDNLDTDNHTFELVLE